MAELSSASMNDLPDSDFAYIEPGGTKDTSGKTIPRSLRHFPVHDKAHVQNALSRAPQSPFGDKAMPKIKAAAKKFGVDVSSDDSNSSRAESPFEHERTWPLEDVSVRTESDGRVVTAYAAVFDTPAEIHDQDGDYWEEIDRSAFNKAISDAAPQGNRKNWRTAVLYNHGRTLMGTPSEMASLPVGIPIDIKADQRGVLTVTRYARTPFCDAIVEGLESGAIPGYSFAGRFMRSQPLIPRGGFRPDRHGNFPTVRRTESTFREYGPTPFPAYKEAGVVGMRAILGLLNADPDVAMRMLSMLRDGTPLEPQSPSGTSLDEEPPPRSRLVHSGRSAKQEIQAARSAFLQRQHRS